MKSYKFSEVVREYENGYKGNFKREDGMIIYYGKKLLFTVDETNEVWYKQDKQVDFMTAINYIDKGREVYCVLSEDRIYHYNDAILHDDEYNVAISTNEILNGTWYIKTKTKEN
jgi:hypothetical protein